MHLPPVSVITSWPAPNYVNPQTHGPGLFIVSIVLLVVVLIVMGARFYTRSCITRTVGPDDILIGAALVIFRTLEDSLGLLTHR